VAKILSAPQAYTLRPMKPFLLALAFATVSLEAQAPITVYVFTSAPASGFVDEASKHRADATKELTDKLRKKKSITVVEMREGADVVVEVKSAAIAAGALHSRVNPLGGGIKTSAQKEYHIETSLSVGDYSTPITAQATFTSIATGKIADDVEKWVKENRDRVLAVRK